MKIVNSCLHQHTMHQTKDKAITFFEHSDAVSWFMLLSKLFISQETVFSVYFEKFSPLKEAVRCNRINQRKQKGFLRGK